jgi:hypothetical protein
MEAVAIDMSGWSPDRSYDECLKLAEQLKLIETLQHGEHGYARITQAGINVMYVLMQLVVYASDPDNKLLKS